jgi:hypothetical protein
MVLAMPDLVSDDSIKRSVMYRFAGLIKTLLEHEEDHERPKPTEQQMRYAFEAMMDFWYKKGDPTR